MRITAMIASGLIATATAKVRTSLIPVPTGARRLSLVDLFEDLCGMPVGFHVIPGPLHLAVRTDEEGGGDGADGLLPVHRLLTPSAVLLHHLLVGVGQEWELELVLR